MTFIKPSVTGGTDSRTDPAGPVDNLPVQPAPPAPDQPPTSADGFLLPVPDEDGAPFWAYAARGELRVQTCADCGELRFPPAPAARTASPSRASGGG